MKIYNVSWMATRDDNGVCCSFTSRDAAEKCLAELIADGVYHAKLWTA